MATYSSQAAIAAASAKILRTLGPLVSAERHASRTMYAAYGRPEFRDALTDWEAAYGALARAWEQAGGNAADLL